MDRGFGHPAVDWIASCVSFVSLLSIQKAQTVGVLFFILPWALIGLRRPVIAVQEVVRNWPLLALPVLALISTAWSDYPAWTLRAGVQYLVTTIIGIMAASCLKPQHFLSSLFFALALMTILSVALGDYTTAFFANEYALIGLFGSKNQMALFLAILLMVSVVVAADRLQPRLFRLMAVAMIPAIPPLLILAKSTSALVVSAAVMMLVPILVVISRLEPAIRPIVVAIGALFVAFIVSVGFFVNLDDVLNVFGKDATLTGRAALWTEAQRQISRQPVLGLGYQAFWQPGNTPAEEIWAHWGLVNKSGFTFHNTYLHVSVDLGLVGLSVLVLTYVGIFLRAVMAVMNGLGVDKLAAICAFSFFLLRSPIEIDVFFQFTIGSVLICVTWVYLAPRRPPRSAAAAGLAVAGAPAGSMQIVRPPPR